MSRLERMQHGTFPAPAIDLGLEISPSARLKRRLLRAVDRRVDPRLIAGLGSVYLSARARSRCAVRYDGGHWIHRYRTGTVVNTVLGGLSAEREDEKTREVFLFDYCPRPGDTVVDIGAGVGGEVRLFSRLVGPSGRVLSIEAHPATFRCLRRTVELNRLGNVTPVECAVVGTAGPVLIEDRAVDHIGNGLTTDTAHGVEVAGRQLGEILAAHGVDHVDLLKMNIEGAELAVLESSLDVLDRVDHLVVSCHDFLALRPDQAWQRTFAPVGDLLRQAGYTLRTRPEDSRAWVRCYIYASRPHRP
ncbi:FkbM family methyltransferase [Micromonospora sp. NPDC049559]|uniref:FkbM family methyltransferase n=1 Tax=Micromonospora sp. NPDC049559 TaxID=3155923 RepID=UPI00342B2BCD